MTSNIKIKCMKKGQRDSLKTLISNQESLYKIIDNFQSVKRGSLEFYDENGTITAEHNYNIYVWIKKKGEKITSQYSIIDNGNIIRGLFLNGEII